MDSQVQQTENESRGKYWLIALISFVACIAFLVFLPEWFWLTLPFLFTYLVKAVGVM